MVRARDVDPSNLEVLLALGVSHTNELEQEGALRYLRGWLQNHPKYGTLVQGDPAKRLISSEALDLKPNYVRAWSNMGIGYANQHHVHWVMSSPQQSWKRKRLHPWSNHLLWTMMVSVEI